MPALPHRAVGHRGGARRGGRRADLHPVRRGRALRRRRHHPGGDDARRHRGCRAPGRRALPPPGGYHGHPAADRAPDPGGRRRARRPLLRHRRSQGHARARPERLRDRPAARSADAVGHGRARPDHRARTVRRNGPVRGPAGGARGAGGRRAHRGRAAAVPTRRRSLLPLPDRRGAPAVPAVVRGGGTAGAGGRGRRPGRAHRHSPARACRPLLRLGRRHARLVHQPAAVVGAPDPGLVLPGWARHRARHRNRRGPHRLRDLRSRRHHPGRRRPGHLVLLGAVAVLDPGLARVHRRPGRVLPDRRPGHRLRHHLLLGGPDDDVRALCHVGRSVPHRRPDRADPRRRRQEDVEVARQRGRPAGVDRPLRRGRTAVYPGPRGQPRHRRPGHRGLGAGQPQLRQQIVERQPVRADERRQHRDRAATAGAAVNPGPVDLV